MTVHKLESEDSRRITQDLSSVVNFSTDLPVMIFCVSDFEFWFFERPLVSFSDILIELIFASYEDFSSAVFISSVEARKIHVFCWTVSMWRRM